MQITDATLIAGLVAVIVAMAKVIEWLIKKYGKNGKLASTTPVVLHPEVNRQIREVYETVTLLIDRDIKAMQQHQERMSEFLEKIAKCLEKTAASQKHTAETLEKIDRRQEVEEEVRRRTAANE